ncbi:hypothetical protein H310_12418 [Aphanomyces invadans]|uniref:Cytochrome b5 heme-binding domain-containing protein n=1 Tax=Aphanomyces invadans TaxID=157072 RepID=A0A024THV8_9STRA|nr:hypothetical protein H310_12418 [Aphanomyces invadans]ETV93648.1 hypothetical protein H310_12418 [Aphanomyces invadans]RHY25303.1 hypothetical protein DYB32_008395 [Aphanomyces invadans]|eukprot:XP_008877689.1 hypothetical protein H310_12418 [Aphanomyces invadans]
MVASAVKVFTLDEIATHNTEKDCWIVIGRAGSKKVYDFTSFINSHPGGPELVLDNAGTDVNDLFEDIGHTSDALAIMDKLCIGTLKEEVAAPAKPKPTKAPAPSAPSDNFFIYVCVFVVAAAAYLQC